MSSIELKKVIEHTKQLTEQERILSLSGGGVKGIADLVVLAEIEERTGKSISELFPIITGTSVGGLVAGLFTIPKEYGSKEPKYSAKEALEILKMWQHLRYSRSDGIAASSKCSSTNITTRHYKLC